MEKVLYFDTETSGVDPIRHDIIQVAGIIEIGGEIKEEFNLTVQPFSYTNISPEALKVNGKTVEEIKTYAPPQDVYKELVSIFSKYIDKYDPTDKFTPAGQNVAFDLEFLRKFWAKNLDEKYFGSWMTNRAVDLRHIIAFLEYAGLIHIPNHKLATIAEHFGLSFEAHDALEDIRITRTLIKDIAKGIKGGPYKCVQK